MTNKKAAGYANTQTAHTQTTHRDSIIVRHAPHWRETLAENLICSTYYADEQDTKSYARVSEPLTITFKPRAASEVMAAAVAAIDAQIVEAQQAVRSLEQRKAELLALPAPEAV